MPSFTCVLASSLTSQMTTFLPHSGTSSFTQTLCRNWCRGRSWISGQFPSPAQRGPLCVSNSALPKVKADRLPLPTGTSPWNLPSLGSPTSGKAALSSRFPRLETQKHLNTFLILLWLFRSPSVSPRFFLTLVPSKNCPASQKIISRRALALKVCKSPWKELPFTGCCICRWHFTVILVRMKISDYFILRCMLFEYKCLPGVSALCYT